MKNRLPSGAIRWRTGAGRVDPDFLQRVLCVAGGARPDSRTRHEIASLDWTHRRFLYLDGLPVATIHPLPWEKKLLNRPCWAAHPAISVADSKMAQRVGSSLNQKGIIWVRVASANTRLIHALNRTGFDRIAEMVNLELPLTRGHLQRMRCSQNIRKGRTEDIAALMKLTRLLFCHDRFHRDERIGARLADKLHCQWVRNSVRHKAADQVLVCETDGCISGFHAIKRVPTENGPTGITVLIGVAREFSGKGIGKALLTAGLIALQQAGARRAWVRTESENLAANRLYASFGFEERSRFWYLRRLNE